MSTYFVIGISTSDWRYIRAYLTAVYRGFERPYHHLEESLNAT
jgi:hypothetical protein